MTTEMRRTGVDVVGDMPWGTHFCLFYETKADLLEILVSYCKAGLQSEEFCLWVVAAPLTEEDAKRALTRALPDFDRYVTDGSIEIVAARDWYLQDGRFELQRVIGGWNEKLARASARGYAGVRVTGDTAWLEKNDWNDFLEYEESLNTSIANQRMAVLCTYPLAACGADEILDVVRTHQFAVTKRRGHWEVIETAGYKQAKAEIKRLNDDLERRVDERTSQLTAVNRRLRKEVLERQHAEVALREAQAELARVARLTTMGELAASIAHEVNQPLTAIVNNGGAGLRWLNRETPDLDEVRGALSSMVSDAMRAGEVIRGLRALAKKSGPQLTTLDVDDAVHEVLALTHSEVQRQGVLLRTELTARDHPVMGDRVQLQQVLLNLILNGIEAMSTVTERAKELTVSSAPTDDGNVIISVEDTGAGLEPAVAQRVFEPFVTTKAGGLGMGLSICRSIIDAHGGRMWVSPGAAHGTAFHFAVPAGAPT
ncbi:MAG TPA: MEDS domain-containing protein [Gemmatimonadaceae bacterium]|jgi:C4-dicarboxylate-specific signal transduction histidine kinase